MTEEIFKMVRCDGCGFVFVSPRPTLAEQDRYYFREYYKKPGKALERPVGGLAKLFDRSRVRSVAAGRRPGRVLDVGCGEGGILARLRELGWEAWGVETSSAGSALAAQRGLKIFNKPLTECGLPERHFDVISFWHSIEHVTEPAAYLKEARRLLKDDGTLFLAFPNIESLEFRLFKGNWFHLDLPRHILHFSPETMGKLLRACGFETKRVSSVSWNYNPFGFLQSALNGLTVEKNHFYRLLKGFKPAGPKGAGAEAWDRAALVAAPFAAAAGALANLAGLGGCVELEARKA
jgi:SAM-dependent methyltransferase